MPVEVEIIWDIMPEIVVRVEAVARSGPKRVADNIVQTMQTLVPIDTGDLHDSMEAVSEVAGYAASVNIGEPYWIFPNYGTRNQAAQPFVEPAIDAHKDELPEEIMVALGG